jgi:putative peptidoglycan binding protein
MNVVAMRFRLQPICQPMAFPSSRHRSCFSEQQGDPEMMRWALVLSGTFLLALAALQVPAEAGGADVERAQQALKQMGHDPGPVDGVIGAQTAAALRAYQKAQGLRVTGQLDAATTAKLGEPAKAPLNSPQTGGDTRPNAVDPSQAAKTGANVGEGASYSRSNEKGQSTK